jgi:hypothetical protein
MATPFTPHPGVATINMMRGVNIAFHSAACGTFVFIGMLTVHTRETVVAHAATGLLAAALMNLAWQFAMTSPWLQQAFYGRNAHAALFFLTIGDLWASLGAALALLVVVLGWDAVVTLVIIAVILTVALFWSEYAVIPLEYLAAVHAQTQTDAALQCKWWQTAYAVVYSVGVCVSMVFSVVRPGDARVHALGLAFLLGRVLCDASFAFMLQGLRRPLAWGEDNDWRKVGAVVGHLVARMLSNACFYCAVLVPAILAGTWPSQ